MLSLTQAISEPNEKLIKGKVYQLKIDNLDELKKTLLLKRNWELGKDGPLEWEIEADIDTMVPELLKKPELVDTRTSYFTCGTSVFAYSKIETKFKSELLIKSIRPINPIFQRFSECANLVA